MTTRKPGHMWTKTEIKAVAELWNTATTKEISEKLDVDYQQLNYTVREMRKAGMSLPKKHKNGNIQSLIKEVMGELNPIIHSI